MYELTFCRSTPRSSMSIRFRIHCILLISTCAACTASEQLTAIRLDAQKLRAEDIAKMRDSESYKIVLVPHEGDGKLDREIVRLQHVLPTQPNPLSTLERLGWAFVAKARASNDPGFYIVAENCALCMEACATDCPEAMLLRGHVLHSMHRFKEAEKLARALISLRQSAFDFGLLGDVLLDQGNLAEASAAYQKMVDLKPCPQSYCRAAQVCWMVGDLPGAVDFMQTATRSASAASESGAWMFSKLAMYELATGSSDNAMRACRDALTLQPDAAPALLMSGRILLAQGDSAAAVEMLRRAEELNPLPEYQWLLADALRTVGQMKDAAAVEARLVKRGAADDPRTLALYLSTRGEQLPAALTLARNELKTRADVFTYDALAWACVRNGLVAEAQENMDRALAEGTVAVDARLALHAAVIAAAAGHADSAAAWSEKANARKQMLFPSELKELNDRFAALSHRNQGDRK